MTPICPVCGGAPSGYRQNSTSPWSVRCRDCWHSAFGATLKEALLRWARGVEA